MPSGQRCGYFADFEGPECPSFSPDRRTTGKGFRPSFYPAAVALAVALAASCGPPGSSGYAQEPHKSKLPGSSGPSRLAFSGNVQSLDDKHDLLSVATVQGGTTEVFSVKKGVHVSAASGKKLSRDTLTPGTNVLVYYEQKAEKRTVTEIIVLSSGTSQGAKKPAPPS